MLMISSIAALAAMEARTPKEIVAAGRPQKKQVPTLKELCFKLGIKKFGPNFIDAFEWLSNKDVQSNADIRDSATTYYNNCYASSCAEIDGMLQKKYPELLLHAPAAQPIDKIVNELYQKKRFDLLKVINERYYARLKWPAITLLASAGHLTAVKILLATGIDTINDRDLYLRTPLICAARNGHPEVVEYLIENGANLDCIDLCNKYDAIKYAQERIRISCNAAEPVKEKNREVLDLLVRAKQKEKNK